MKGERGPGDRDAAAAGFFADRKQKDLPAHAMKGQLVFEFVVAAILFIGIVFFVLSTLTSTVSVYSGDYLLSNLEGKALAASEALVKTREGAGLAVEWPILNSTRISDLNYFCSLRGSYPLLLDWLNLKEKPGFGNYGVRIVINQTGGTLLDCKPPFPPFLPVSISSSFIKRFGVLDTSKELLEVNVWVW